MTRDPHPPELAISAALLHELRQPLFAAKARLQLAQVAGSLGGPEIRELLDHVRHLEDLLEQYAPISPTSPGFDAPVDLREEVSRALAMLGARIAAAGATVEVHLPPGPLRVHGRPVAWRQVVLNLVRNALDAVSEAAPKWVRVEARAGERGVLLIVEDSGPGLTAEVERRLFEPYVTTKGTGTGLGLFVARRLTEEVGATLEARAGTRGACFVVTVPPG